MLAVRPVVLTLVVALALAACRADGPSAAPDSVRAAAVEHVLAARSAAVLAADRSALAGTSYAGADPAVKDLGQRLAAVPILGWTYTVRSSKPGPVPGEVSVTAELDYRLAADPAGLPPASALRSLMLTSDPSRPGSLVVRSDRPVGAWLPWDLGPVAWSASAGAAVIDVRAHPSAQTDDALLVGARKAASAVTSVWGSGWRRLPVLVAVQGADQLAELTGRRPADVAGLVALTTTDRVYVDVDAWQALPPAGRQVILSHEVTHLATRAAADPNVPLWLEEGFADFVGLRGSGIPVGTVAAALLGPVAAGAPAPAQLPSDADFAAGGATVSRAYAGAWLACRLIAASRGTAALVALYRATSAGDGDPAANADAALRAVTGQGTALWTARWRASVVAAATAERSRAATAGAAG